ncbi:P-loop containing nucleoside triphosphate hydrolase protein [Suillus fuscotomentosus]|uniref:P-loop containing nucleoside triphosphate hydrolase protein n=1 Tax=Suillus fuscotomentosus TaxID=1912939 RepID=A0AAD4ECF6_9AGAM|nr:P-loop containing nucleoside triphosphate hydrolase protein [Suillus fuscotomentosus]KAG1903684.1 P-loop containing nucleoside triphosphate hydrolase protein [Suillus fuscotomentosus]
MVLKSHYFFDEKDAETQYRSERARVDTLLLQSRLRGSSPKPSATREKKVAKPLSAGPHVEKQDIPAPSDIPDIRTRGLPQRPKTPYHFGICLAMTSALIMSLRTSERDNCDLRINKCFGRSTQVPVFILEDQLARGLPCKIYCTEPRRISAVSLAQRVSRELGDSAGAVGTLSSLVGYSIRLESNTTRNTRLAFVMNGIALRMLEGGTGPNGQGTAFDEITHIIIDEVHERSIESDFLLIVLKSLLSQRSDLKIILMSATVDADKLSNYFNGCPTLHVPGRTFPVDVHFLEDAIDNQHRTIGGSSSSFEPTETGITIPDITCVIDTGKHREMRFDEKHQLSCLVETFVAKSNAAQHRGRAGRVQNGLCFHLFTKIRHDTSVRALTPSEDITPMGRLLSMLPTDVHVGKLLLTAVLFRSLDPALTIAAALSSKSPFIVPMGMEQEADRAKSSFHIDNSDFLMIHNAFSSWRRASENPSFVRKICQVNFLSHQNLQQIEELRQQFLGNFVRELSRYVTCTFWSLVSVPLPLDSNGSNIALNNSALTAGLYPKVLAIDSSSGQMRTISNNQSAAFHPTSANFGRKPADFGVNHLVYFTLMHSKKMYAWETGPIDDLALVLLCGESEFKLWGKSKWKLEMTVRS